MKKFTQFKWMLLLIVCAANAQQEKGIVGSTNWLNNWTDFKPAKTEHNESDEILFGKIDKNKTLFKKSTYLLQGAVYVTNGAKLTIEAGTVIRGDFDTNGSLIITKGATIEAIGTETDPIVFTSNKAVRKAGDWGGLVVLGDAPINKFGGTAALNYDLDPTQTIYGGANAQSNSGVLRFVRIEFAGKKVKGYKDFNALSIAGVGNKTVIENVMCSFANNTSVEVLGGEVAMNKMVTFKSNGDDFRFTQGTQAKIDNSLAIRHSYVSNSTRSRCLDVASYEKKEETDFSKGLTNVVATNITMANCSETLGEDLKSGLLKEGIFISSNSTLALKRSVISGFAPGIVFDDEITIDDKNLKKIKIEEVYFNKCKGNILVENTSNDSELEDYYGQGVFFNLYESVENKELFIDSANAQTKYDYRIKIGKFTAGAGKN
jgi:hypothetical protein